jgi:glutathione peroxidase
MIGIKVLIFDAWCQKYSSSKVILVVNTASFCGYTQRNYKQLQDIYTRLHPQGLEILAFPCNQFGAQEPYGYSEIVEYVTSNFAVSFPVLGKVILYSTSNSHLLYLTVDLA